MNKYLANQKLWRIIRQPEAYYYEIKLAGMVIDRLKIDEDVIKNLKEEGVIHENEK